MATIEKLAGSKVKLSFEVSADSFEDALQKAYIKTGKKYTVPGFRKGHAPRKMIESSYGPLAFFDDAFDIIYPDLYEAAIKEHGIEPVDRPDVSIDDFNIGGDLKFSMEVAVKPDVTLGQYKGIEVEKQEYNVTDEMVNAEIEREREKIASFEDVDRPVENGDTVNLDYSGSVDGVKFDGGTAEGQTLVIGSNTFIPGFEAQMVGMKTGEEKELSVKFPDEYHSDELKGKDAVFAVKVNGIQVKKLPDIDDDFVKDISEYNTVEELRDAKRRELTEAAQSRIKSAKENMVIQGAIDNATVEVPDAMIERQLDYLMQDVGYRLSMQGISLQDYCKYTGGTEESMRAEFRNEAEQRVKGQLVLAAVTKAENITATPDEVDAKIEEYAKQYGRTAEQLKENLTDEDKEYFRDQVVMDKTVAVLVDSAVEVKAKKAAAKKPAAKKAEKADEGEAPAKKPAAKKPAAKKAEKAEEGEAPAKKPAAKKAPKPAGKPSPDNEK